MYPRRENQLEDYVNTAHAIPAELQTHAVVPTHQQQAQSLYDADLGRGLANGPKDTEQLTSPRSTSHSLQPQGSYGDYSVYAPGPIDAVAYTIQLLPPLGEQITQEQPVTLLMMTAAMAAMNTNMMQIMMENNEAMLTAFKQMILQLPNPTPTRKNNPQQYRPNSSRDTQTGDAQTHTQSTYDVA